jgi:Tfp pilus assembly protein PilV
MTNQNRRGFSAVEAVIAVFVVASIGVTGYLAYNRMKDSDKAQPTASEQTEDAAAPVAPDVKNVDDLDTAVKTLDDTDIDATASDSADLDAEASSF